MQDKMSSYVREPDNPLLSGKQIPKKEAPIPESRMRLSTLVTRAVKWFDTLKQFQLTSGRVERA
jgi:hypothetical protein